MSLAVKNAHPRDEHIQFIEEGHLYIVDGDTTYTSVTTFIHGFFKPFDAKTVIQKMKKSQRWSTSPYYGKTDEEIMDEWEQKRVNSASSGTYMHQQIERFYNGEESDTEPIQKEWQLFNGFERDFARTPYRTEWYVYDEEAKLAGSIDMVFLDADNDRDLIIVDWKRTSELKSKNFYQKGLYPVNHLDDCNFSHYSLQLNTYKYILEKNYGKRVTQMFLVVLHPNNSEYIQVEVPVLQHEVRAMVQERSQPKRGLVFLRNR